MTSTTKIFLPGLEKQVKFLQKNLLKKIECTLVIGSSSDLIAAKISNLFNCEADLIVEDYDSLMNSKLSLKDNSKVSARLMDFEVTDFDSSTYDLVYAQASISLTNRNKIIKEICRVLKPGGFLCVGEIVALKKEYPKFIQDIFSSSNLLPLYINDLEKYYSERKFDLIASQELNAAMKEYYIESAALLKNTKENLNSQEKSYYKKILNKVSHESNAYLKLGGEKYIGFVALLLQKGGA